MPKRKPKNKAPALPFKAFTLVGKRGSGKTTWLLENIIKPGVRNGAKGLVINTDNPNFPSNPYYGLSSSTNLSDIDNIQPGQILVYVLQNPGNKKQLKEQLDYIVAHFKGGLMVLDDTTSYIKNPPVEEVERLFVQHKNNRVNVFCMYHHLRLPQFLRENSTHLVVFRLNHPNGIDHLQHLYPDYFDQLQNAFTSVVDKEARGIYYDPEIFPIY